jgi:6-phosphogluconate dehydrogenase
MKGEGSMEIGMVGLGKMGGNMTTRLLGGGHQVVVYDRNPPRREKAQSQGAVPADSLRNMVEALTPTRAIWCMLPAGEATQTTVSTLADHLEPGDIIIDGGNSNYHDTISRGKVLAAKGIHYVDVGTSGGIWGLEQGYSMMVGGSDEAVAHLTPAFETLAPGKSMGWGHVGPPGSGHFVKMVHNGIEYGMMQAYAEGFEILQAKSEFELDLHAVAEIWRYGSVIRSWLLDLTAGALEDMESFDKIEAWVADSGEGRWTIQEAIDLDVPAPVITLSLFMRFVSRQEDSTAARLLAAMRNQFGGHAVREIESKS